MDVGHLISTEILGALFDICPSGIAVADENGRYLQVNDAYCALFGYSRAELIGQTFGIILCDDDKSFEPNILQMALTQDESAPSEWRVQHRDGRSLLVHSAFKTFLAPDGSARILTILSDVTTLLVSLHSLQNHQHQLKQSNTDLEALVQKRTLLLEDANRELVRLATQDSLTGLYNRRAFEVEAEKAIYTADRHHRPMSILFLDIDHFKLINDQYGHAVGDEVLRNVARQIVELLRSSDLMARWGGEEFVLILPDTGLEQAVVVGEKILSAVRQMRFMQQNSTFAITISGGLIERHLHRPLEESLQEADHLLYQAKQAGRNRLEWIKLLPRPVEIEQLQAAY
ncbi:sensor domain-containing diguanylate cyclase [Chitinibacter sp. SCUT-21]|uniref:sensor domain-containing diguanylate cyclase n=1 Tax=Chitinibacter sp. SCUT-21 TaxID=2970891 RepID=UPI0035A67439